MASADTKTIVVPIALDTEALDSLLQILRRICSEVGWTLDSAIVDLQALRAPQSRPEGSAQESDQWGPANPNAVGLAPSATSTEMRLAALDRAIARMSHDRQVDAAAVVAMATTFESFLKG